MLADHRQIKLGPILSELEPYYIVHKKMVGQWASERTQWSLLLGLVLGIITWVAVGVQSFAGLATIFAVCFLLMYFPGAALFYATRSNFIDGYQESNESASSESK